MRGDKQVGLFDVIKNGYDKDDDLKDLEELMYDNSKEAGNKMSINDMIKSFELNESDKTSKKKRLLITRNCLRVCVIMKKKTDLPDWRKKQETDRKVFKEKKKNMIIFLIHFRLRRLSGK